MTDISITLTWLFIGLIAALWTIAIIVLFRVDIKEDKEKRELPQDEFNQDKK